MDFKCTQLAAADKITRYVHLRVQKYSRVMREIVAGRHLKGIKTPIASAHRRNVFFENIVQFKLNNGTFARLQSFLEEHFLRRN